MCLYIYISTCVFIIIQYTKNMVCWYRVHCLEIEPYRTEHHRKSALSHIEKCIIHWYFVNSLSIWAYRRQENILIKACWSPGKFWTMMLRGIHGHFSFWRFLVVSLKVSQYMAEHSRGSAPSCTLFHTVCCCNAVVGGWIGFLAANDGTSGRVL